MADEVEIESLGARGDGVAEGGALYVPYTLPGERVRVVRHGDLGGGRARAEAVLTPSPERVVPQCPHFGTCGGCSLQHASDRFTARWKRDLIATALGARGIAKAAIRPTITSAPETRRRITLPARPTRQGGSGCGSSGPGCSRGRAGRDSQGRFAPMVGAGTGWADFKGEPR